MKRVSIVCVYNKPAVYQNVLVNSLSQQDCKFEVIGVENESGRFSSAAKALNYGARQVTGDFLIFVHQDVSFEESNSLQRLVDIFEKCSVLGDIGGIVGRGYNEQRQPYIVAGSKVDFLGEKVGNKGFSGESTEVETVDEFLLIMSRETYLDHPFDEKACNGWHFYGVEQCLNAQISKHKVYVINTDIKHHSPGKIDHRFYWAQLRIAKKYSSYGRVIGTCCDFDTRSPFKLFLRAVKSTIKETIFR